MRLSFILIFFILFAPLNAAAQQSLYIDVSATNLPGDTFMPCMDADAGDADGDGDLDLVLAVEFGVNLLLLNDGTGNLNHTSQHIPVNRHDSEDVSFADFDNDGDLDLLFVSEDDQTNELYLNEGNGSFIDASDRIPVMGISNAHAVADFDNDGDIDIAVGNIGSNRLLMNNGNAAFSDRTDGLWQQDSRTQDLEAIDIDRDGDIDIVEANEGRNRLYLNQSDGRLIDATVGSLPEITDETREIRAADLDDDGDLDLIVANVSFIFDYPRTDYILINDGNNKYARAGPERMPEDDQDHFTVQVVDLDGDGDLDIVTASTLFGGFGEYRVLLNNGAAVFSPAKAGSIFPLNVNGNGFDIEVADFNADGKDDLFLCNRLSEQRLLFQR